MSSPLLKMCLLLNRHYWHSVCIASSWFWTRPIDFGARRRHHGLFVDSDGGFAGPISALLVELLSKQYYNGNDVTVFTTFVYQVRCGHISGKFSYLEIMEASGITAAFGKWGYHIFSLLQFMYPFLGKKIVCFYF